MLHCENQCYILKIKCLGNIKIPLPDVPLFAVYLLGYLQGPSQPPPLHSRPFTHINPVSVSPSPSSSSTSTPTLPLLVSLLLSPLPLRAPSA